MGLRRPECCAYCGQPLQLVAGFCVGCQAPAKVAQHPRIVADARRRAGVALTGYSMPMWPGGSGALALPGAPPRPTPRWVAFLASAGFIACIIFALSIGARLSNVAAPFLPASDSLTASMSPTGKIASTFTVGQPVYLAYTAQAAGDIGVRITIDNATPFTFIEYLTKQQQPRTLRYAASMPGTWKIALLWNQKPLQTLVLSFIPTT